MRIDKTAGIVDGHGSCDRRLLRGMHRHEDIVV